MIKQIISPRYSSGKSYQDPSFAFSPYSDEDDQDDDDEDDDMDTIKEVSQFATLPTQISSISNVKMKEIRQLFTSPLKHYKHLSKYQSSSEPLKHCNNNRERRMNCEYDKIISLQKEINSLNNELKPNQQRIKNDDGSSNNNVQFMKKQIVELLVDKEKLTTKCRNLV